MNMFLILVGRIFDLIVFQIIRYCLGGTPLWVSSENIPQEKDIPNCTCGSKRGFEFQVSLLLYYFTIHTFIKIIYN